MKQRIQLIAAPPALQPGGYVKQAYADHVQPHTTDLDVRVDALGTGWEVFLSWRCAEPSRHSAGDVTRFADGAGIMAPAHADAPLMTMGSGGAGVDGWLWHADREQGWRFRAAGLGTVDRIPMPVGARVDAGWQDGRWGVRFELPEWASLGTHRRIGFAIWQGAAAERGGLKSISPGWIELP
ncbi:MAG: hypothetical protein AB7I04_13465 [Pseudomonadales bacterium]